MLASPHSPKEDAITPLLIGTIDLGAIMMLAFQGRLDEMKLLSIFSGFLAGILHLFSHFMRTRSKRMKGLWAGLEIIFSPFFVFFLMVVSLPYPDSYKDSLQFALYYFMGGIVCYLYGQAVRALSINFRRI